MKVPRLAEMGVLHPEEIVHFAVNSIDYTDHLRIVYERPKGSILPESRQYRFPRVQRTHKTAGDASKASAVMESSEQFREAIAELQSLLAAKEEKQQIGAQILDEIRQFEEQCAMHNENLRDLVNKIQSN